jgi:hypothetical protein
MRWTMAPSTALLSAGCLSNHVCNQMFVPDQLTIEVAPPIEASGVWRIEADGLGCSVELPLEGGTFECDDVATFQTDGGSLVGVTVQDSADEVTLRVLHDGLELFEQTRRPEWSESEPNGEGCGVTRVGTEVIEQSW